MSFVQRMPQRHESSLRKVTLLSVLGKVIYVPSDALHEQHTSNGLQNCTAYNAAWGLCAVSSVALPPGVGGRVENLGRVQRVSSHLEQHTHRHALIRTAQTRSSSTSF